MTAFETATALASAGEYGPALTLLAAIEEPAGDATVLRGWCLENLDQPAEAIAAYGDALAVDPTNLEALDGLANVAAALGRDDQAAAQWAAVVTEVESRQRPSGRELELAGWSLFRLGRLREADRSLRAALAVRPCRASARFDLGLVLLAHGDGNGARAEYAAAADGSCGAAAAIALDDLLAARRTLGAPAETVDAIVRLLGDRR